MPEGHSVHRITAQFARHFEGAPVAVSSPQGRFAADARLIDGRTIVRCRAVGKQMFLEFDNGLWLRVHLGMYGAWDFAGDIDVPAVARDPESTARDNADSLASMGAPRRLRMAESERLGAELEGFPPEPIGQVRVRLLTDHAVADLRGPTACEVLDGEGVDAVLARLGPDPLVDGRVRGEKRFLELAGRKRQAIGLVLMDQSVVSGIGNVYRAEMLFRARLSPFATAAELPRDVLSALWTDWDHLLRIGVKTGQMLTMDGLRGAARARALASRDDRHWVYHRTGLPCRVCGTEIAMQEMAGRKLYWCPLDQA
ncbi:formamidopyrimidine-DNA glycosylase [Schumannella luteola]|uniref:DNA-(apurinic or apyrimidinic site) lyase n=1 Tax=Schumannella luteola TaxID=472059 RepID=A0A852YT14_9MICO|nr:DNA-formamidopyrimidine glycosylase family protein [Schumannella luteola]NYH00436.1 formamidopyrimidine-DNA glycosylase [Schumannella luteola]TPX03652.1 Fpg/Nei family DNA glycosylase [Schumannella luteola]